MDMNTITNNYTSKYYGDEPMTEYNVSIEDKDGEYKMEKYAQHVEINVNDASDVILALINAGYECRVWNDGESMEVVAIDYIHPEYDGHTFKEVER